MQQFYNIADTLIVGRVIGKNALAAVGSAYTLMTFLTSVFLGLSINAIQLSIISVVFCHREPLFFMPKNFKNITKNS